MHETAIPSFDIDPFSVAYFDDPFPVQSALRDAGPVVWLSRYHVYAVARYDEVRAMLLDWQTFSSARGVGLSDFAKEPPWRPKSLVLETDPPLHDRTRGVLNKVLSVPVVSRLKERFVSEAEALVDRLLARGEADAVADIAEAYPLTVFPDALGMPRENAKYLLPYSNMVFNSFGPRNGFFEDAVKDAEPVFEWLARQVKREALSPDGIAADIYRVADSGVLSAQETPMVVRSLITAGVDTTVNSLAAAVFCLVRFPEQWDALRSDPTLARAAFEEAIRFEAPVQTFFRTTARDVEIGGHLVPEGAKVLMFLGAANRDPRQWQNPDLFDVRRKTAGHVGFGAGIHMCVGQLLARLEGEAVLLALARRVRHMSFAGEPRRRYNNTLRGFASMPINLA